MWMRPVEYKSTQRLVGIGACIIPKNIHQSHEDPLIDVERRLRQSPVLPHPQTKLAQQRPAIRIGWRRDRRRQVPLLLKKLHEGRGSRQRMVIRSTATQNEFFRL